MWDLMWVDFVWDFRILKKLWDLSNFGVQIHPLKNVGFRTFFYHMWDFLTYFCFVVSAHPIFRILETDLLTIEQDLQKFHPFQPFSYMCRPKTQNIGPDRGLKNVGF